MPRHRLENQGAFDSYELPLSFTAWRSSSITCLSAWPPVRPRLNFSCAQDLSREVQTFTQARAPRTGVFPFTTRCWSCFGLAIPQKQEVRQPGRQVCGSAGRCVQTVHRLSAYALGPRFPEPRTPPSQPGNTGLLTFRPSYATTLEKLVSKNRCGCILRSSTGNTARKTSCRIRMAPLILPAFVSSRL